MQAGWRNASPATNLQISAHSGRRDDSATAWSAASRGSFRIKKTQAELHLADPRSQHRARVYEASHLYHPITVGVLHIEGIVSVSLDTGLVRTHACTYVIYDGEFVQSLWMETQFFELSYSLQGKQHTQKPSRVETALRCQDNCSRADGLPWQLAI